MKYFLSLLFFLFSYLNFAQVFGEIANEKRPIVKNINYEISGSKPGVIFFIISVDEKGNVVSCKVDRVKTTVHSTPLSVKATNLIKSTLKFKSDSIYPQFQRGIVKITIKKA